MSQAIQQESNEAYHADKTHVSASMLKALNESPRIYEAKYVTAEMAFSESPAMKVGTAVHCFALEPDEAIKRYPKMPAFECDEANVTGKGDRSYSTATKYYKSKVAEWEEQNRDAVRLTKDQLATVLRCTSALRRIPLVRMMLDHPNRVIEKSIRWDDSMTNTPCKVRADLVIPEKKIILDIKTVSECTQPKAEFQCEDFGYDIQEAHYRTGWANHTGTDVDDWSFYFAFVETSQPHRCRAVSTRLGQSTGRT